MTEQPVTTCPTCGAAVTIVGHTTLHYQPVTEQDRYDANIGAYVQAATARADRAEAALQVARAEAAALREMIECIVNIRDYSLVEDYPDVVLNDVLDQLRNALSGDAGAAYLREREAMQRVVEEARATVKLVAQMRAIDSMLVEPFWTALHIDDIAASLDALSAPAVEPEIERNEFDIGLYDMETDDSLPPVRSYRATARVVRVGQGHPLPTMDLEMGDEAFVRRVEEAADEYARSKQIAAEPCCRTPDSGDCSCSDLRRR